MNIGFDLDGVCYPWQEIIHAYCYAHNLTTETNPQIFWTSWLANNEEVIQGLTSINTFYVNGNPYVGLLPMLHRLKERYNIYYITSRPKSSEEETFKYLFSWGFPDFENLLYTKDKPKAIQGLDIIAYVEDRVELAVAMHPYTKVFLVDKPYNRAFITPEGMIRIPNTTEVEKYL